METSEKAPKRRKFLNARSRQVIIKCLLLAFTSLFLVWLLEYRHLINDPAAAWNFVFSRPLVFLYTTLIMFFILLFIYGIFRKTFLSISVATSLVLIMGYIHISKFIFRGAPLFPDDFSMGSQAATLTKFVDVGGIVRLVLAVILCLALGILLDNLTAKWPKNTQVKSNVWWRRYRIISRVAIITVAISGFLITTDFARNHTNERTIKLGFLNSSFIDWDQTQNYHDNGFLLGFLYNLNKLQISAPDGYSKEKMAQIDDKWKSKKAQVEAEQNRTPFSDIDANIVFILNESFYDPETLSGDVYRVSGEDVTPNLHRIQEKINSGTMFSVDYGGGTANIEYEIMTGFTNYWLKTMPYPNLLPKQKSVPSIAAFAKENGFETAVVHPFNGGVYKREVVLPKMGFDDLIFDTEFSHKETYGESEYITDSETYSEMLDLLARKDQKQFVSVITMQNHAPYTAGLYGETSFKASAGEHGEELTEDEKDSIETYLMSLHKSDEALGELVDKLDKFNEKTIVVFYGDHSPGVFPQVIENKDKTISDSARQTPYLIYANFDLGERQELPETTPNCIANTLLNMLGSKKPSYFYLLDTVCETDPILTDAYFGSEAPFITTELSEYNLLTYDQVAGKQYI